MKRAGKGNQHLQLFGGLGSWTIEKLYDPVSGTVLCSMVARTEIPEPRRRINEASVDIDAIS